MKHATRWKAIFATALVAVVLWGVAEVAVYDPDWAGSTDTSQPVQPLPEATWDPPLPPVQRPTPTPEPTAEESKAEVERKAEPAPTAQPAPQPEPKPQPKPEPKPDVVKLAPITAFQDQAAVDTGALVTYIDPARFGFCLIAGHDNMGWAWLDDLAVGTIVWVTQGPCTGEYEVVGHEWQETKGGQHPEWMHNYDLILQTCTGNSGTGFSLAVRR